MKSILQTEQECFLCGRKEPLHEHHVINGTSGRAKSTKWNLTLYLCPACHEHVHTDQGVDLMLKKYAQKTFELLYGHEVWVNEFHKNYL